MKYFAISFVVCEYLCSKDPLSELSPRCYSPSSFCFQPTTHHTSPFHPCTHSCKSEDVEKPSQEPHNCTKIWCLYWVVSICLCPAHDSVVGFSNAHVSAMPKWSNVRLWLESLDLWQLPMTITSPEWSPMDCSMSEMKFYSVISYFLSCCGTDCNFKIQGRVNLRSEVYKNGFCCKYCCPLSPNQQIGLKIKGLLAYVRKEDRKWLICLTIGSEVRLNVKT